MSQGRDNDGQFEEKMRNQDLLKVFDYADDPMLTAQEIADGLTTHFRITVTTQAVRDRLKRMESEQLVTSKEFGARAVGWYAQTAPALADDTAEIVDERRGTDTDEFVSLDS